MWRCGSAGDGSRYHGVMDCFVWEAGILWGYNLTKHWNILRICEKHVNVSEKISMFSCLNFPNFLLIRLGGEDKSKNLYWSLRTETTLRKNISRPRTTCYFSLFSQQIRSVLCEIRKVLHNLIETHLCLEFAARRIG